VREFRDGNLKNPNEEQLTARTREKLVEDNTKRQRSSSLSRQIEAPSENKTLQELYEAKAAELRLRAKNL
jgi:hypothetical protein